MCSGPQVAKIIDNQQVKAASKLVVVGIAPFIAKLGITAGANIETILNAGPAGACFSINREYHMALINNIYGSDSAEARGSLCLIDHRRNGRYDLLRDIGVYSGNDRMV